MKPLEDFKNSAPRAGGFSERRELIGQSLKMIRPTASLRSWMSRPSRYHGAGILFPRRHAAGVPVKGLPNMTTQMNLFHLEKMK